MRKVIIGKFMALAVVGLMVLSGCTSGIKASGESQNKSFTIGISQLAEHPALDDARRGFEDALKELGVDAKLINQNAQGDIPTSLSIAQKFVKDEVDLIFAIATPAAQTAKQATDSIPIIFSAVTDPVIAELIDSVELPGGNITGTSDAAPIEAQLRTFKELNKDIEKIGIIYSTDEANSQIQIDIVKELAGKLDLEIITVGISEINDISQAVSSLSKKVDGIYTITDNTVASAINVVAQKAMENNLITVGAEDSHVSGGILFSDGISYYELGRQSARMAKEILVDGKSPATFPSEVSNNTKKSFNASTLKTLGLDENSPVFKDATKVD